MLKETSPPDPTLIEVFTQINQVTDKINQVKKQKDTVDGYLVSDSARKINIVHGFSKKMNRGKQQVWIYVFLLKYTHTFILLVETGYWNREL